MPSHQPEGGSTHPSSLSTTLHPAVGARPEEVFQALMHGDLGQTICSLPKQIQQRFIHLLEGVRLPEAHKHRLRFLRELEGLAARLMEPRRLETERVASLLGRPGYQAGMVGEDLGALEKTFVLIREIASVCMRSSKPADYVRLISRPGVDIPRFMATMPFFAGDRQVRLTSLDMGRRRMALEMERLSRQNTMEAMRSLLSLIVAQLPPLHQHMSSKTASDWKVLHAFDTAAVMVRDTQPLARVLRSDHASLVFDKSFFQLHELLHRIAAAKRKEDLVRHIHSFLIARGIYRTQSGQMLRFGKLFTYGPIEGYVVLRPESLMRYGYAAMTTLDVDDATVLLASEDERMVQHELQHVFDKITYVEQVVGPRHEGAGTTEILLGMEIRARLGEMAFSQNRERVREALEETRDNAALELPTQKEMRLRVQADQVVSSKLLRCKEGGAVRRMARRVLDQAYRQAYGLTYSQIVEPFSRSHPSQ